MIVLSHETDRANFITISLDTKQIEWHSTMCRSFYEKRGRARNEFCPRFTYQEETCQWVTRATTPRRKKPLRRKSAKGKPEMKAAPAAGENRGKARKK